MLRYTTRPISDRSAFSGKHEYSRFTVAWSQSLDLLEREYKMLRGRDLVIEVDVREQDIRNDGMIRANARPDSPAVRLAFESKHGPLLYSCDRYKAPLWRLDNHQHMTDWQHNVHAIAKTLEALRAVERYSASLSGEQYRGYLRIGSAAEVMEFFTPESARAYLESFIGATPPDDVVLVHLAKRKAHPDTGGSADQWHTVQRAEQCLMN